MHIIMYAADTCMYLYMYDVACSMHSHVCMYVWRRTLGHPLLNWHSPWCQLVPIGKYTHENTNPTLSLTQLPEHVNYHIPHCRVHNHLPSLLGPTPVLQNCFSEQNHVQQQWGRFISSERTFVIGEMDGRIAGYENSPWPQTWEEASKTEDE